VISLGRPGLARDMTRTILLPALAALLLPALLRPRQDPAPAGDRVAELVGKLKAKTDLSDPKIVEELAALRTRPALDGLLEVYSAMSTVWMKREIVRSLRQFDGVPDAELPALQRLMDVATQDPEPELRRAALDGLGQCKSKGKDFLSLIINSGADDDVREHAMEMHVGLADANDHAWYRELYKPKTDDHADKDKKGPKEKPKEKPKGVKDFRAGANKDPKKKGEDTPPEPAKVKALDGIRRRAFEVILADLTPDDLVEALLDHSYEIRRDALEELDHRQDKRTLDLAQGVLAKITPQDTDGFTPKSMERADVRVSAAKIVARLSGPKITADFIKRGTGADTPEELRRGLADILASFKDPAVNRELLAQFGHGHERDKLFVLHAVSGIQDEKIDRAIEKMLFDREQEVVIAACKALADRNDKDAVPQLQKLVGKIGKEKPLARAALDAMATLRSGDPKWIDELLAMTKGEDPDVRNMALQALGRTSDKKFLSKIIEALDDKDWSTRLAALDALEAMKTKEAIPAIVARMGKEDGRMLAEFSATLYRLTGQPFEDNVAAWDNWWKQSGEKFELMTPEKLEKIKASAEEWRLKQATRVQSKFFGIRIVSHKVIFVVDVSGSMDRPVENFEGKSGMSRIEVAKVEMDKAIQSLEQGSFFNIIIFSSGVDHWVEGGLQAASQKNRDEAQAFIDKTGAGGGTSTYDAMKEAFKDPDVDTIFIMSDGEPTTGEETDPLVIREHIKQWNEHRGIVINAIAIGGKHDVLQWLAEDSGGTYKSYD
jgi:HEAT repeat protein